MSSTEAIDEQIASLVSALDEFTIETRADRIKAQDRLSVLWWQKYRQTGHIADLQNAVHYSRAATDNMGPEEHSDVLSHLGTYLVELFKESMDMKTIDEGIRIIEQNRDSLPNNSQDLGLVTKNLSVALVEKVIHCTEPDDMDKAIGKMRDILSSFQPGQPNRGGMFIKLGTMLAHRYSRGSVVTDLEEAIELAYKAMQESQDSSEITVTLANLSAILYIHHKRTGLSRSLEEALRISRLRLDRPTGHPVDRSTALLNHGTYLHHKSQRYRVLNSPESLEILGGAITYGREALETLPPDSFHLRSEILGMLGVWQTTKMQMTNMLDFGAEGIKFLTDALQSMETQPAAAVARTHRNLAHTYDVYFQILKASGEGDKALENLDHAIHHSRIAIQVSPKDDPEFGSLLKNLASLLLQKCWGQDPYLNEGTDDEITFQESKELFVAAATNPKASPLIRISSSIQAASMYWRDDDSEPAQTLLRDAIALLSQINPREMPSEDLQEALRQVSGLASLATSTALAAECPVVEALQTLEAAHCIISGFFMSSKSDIPELRMVNPELASKYDCLRSRLASLSRADRTSEDFFESRTLQQSLLNELSQTESEIKRMPGFERFQEILSEDEFRSLASDGPIIVINISRVQSDAIIVTANGIRVLPLPELEYRDLERKLKLFGELGNETRRDAVAQRQPREQGGIVSATKWLWKVAVELILDNVSPDLTSTRRVWWMQTGLAGHMPLHAAGDYSEGSTENTMSRVISSYISSFKALKYARERPILAPRVSRHNMLLVTVSMNPYPHMNLNTSYEEQVAKEIFGSELTHLSQPEPKSVLGGIPNHSFVHFACHGFSSINNPSMNGLLLVKDEQAATLTISDLEAVDHRAGAVAYLSACSTAEQSDLKLMDEAIHLANSFQTAGFQHVIGTLWGADDRAAGEVAREFYNRLTLVTSDNGHRSGLEVASALHEAIIQVKQSRSGRNNIVEWGPFIHIGT